MNQEEHLDDERLARWLRDAGPRAMPSEAARRRAYDAAKSRWRARLKGRHSARSRFVPWWVGVSIAAMLVVAIGVAYWSREPPATETIAFARLERSDAPLRISPAGGPERTLATGDGITIGASLATGPARVALTAGGGLSLRLDRHTELQVVAADRVALRAGSLYLDSGPTAGRRLAVETPDGIVEHDGTQYLATVADGVTRLAVREGTLRLAKSGDPPGRATLVPHGRALEVASGREPVWSDIEPYGARWQWAAEIAPPFAIDGRSVAAFLDWICRENGWRSELDAGITTPELEHLMLRGSIEGMTPRESLELVASVADITITLDAGQGVLRIARADDGVPVP